MSLFELTKDAGTPLGLGRGISGVEQYGISYQPPTVQAIIQSPQTDYMASLDKIINDSMFKGLI